MFSKSKKITGARHERNYLRKKQKPQASAPKVTSTQLTAESLFHPVGEDQSSSVRETTASAAESFHTASPPASARPHKHKFFHNLSLGQWEYQLCKCDLPETHKDAWDLDVGPVFLDKFGKYINWAELCERVLHEADRESLTRQEYLGYLPRVLERSAAEVELDRELMIDITVALGGTILLND
jgi:hypothetical protein